MSYQVLARKWRPKNFQELMGQEHVVTVLANALSQQRLHHAYLFTGTRGVGKTTIARIFAKSLNCEKGLTDKPCGQCDTCVDIDQGRFVDLLEIDAASKTKVDDTREILDNVQYAPSRGRYKVYLIDEVHMLSRHSFNALLKTLEEPPAHVKFILATTDPQKLPITVLSRCLQFHLKALTVKQIESKLVEILTKENVGFEPASLTVLAKAARGSMRDSLSLTDQAIAQGKGNITLANIQLMLGGIDQNWVYKILIALLKQDGQDLMALSQDIASYAPNYSRLFAELIQLFHQIALMQIVEQHFDLPADKVTLLKKFSQAMSAEDIQLYYQISIDGRKDLPYAADEQAAFDMTLLRLFAFKPMVKEQLQETKVQSLVQQNNAFQVTESKRVEIEPLSIEPLVEAQLPEENQQAEYIEESQVNLADEMAAIEQQAVEIQSQSAERFEQSSVKADVIKSSRPTEQHATEKRLNLPADEQVSTTQLQPSQAKEALHAPEVSQAALTDSPLDAVLATRNMLRSRKKLLESQAKKPSDAKARQSSESHLAVTAAKAENDVSEVVVQENTLPEPEAPYQQESIDPATIRKANQVDKWAHMIDSMQLTARIRQLAIHATISDDSTAEHLILLLDQATRHLNTQVAQEQLQTYISEFLGSNVTVTLNLVEKTVADPYQIQGHINDKRFDYAKNLIKADNIVVALQEKFQATLDEESITAR
jgi:DNA polymerase-3 subunit gamma/tau